MPTIQTDIAIFGGGIAGLWTLAALRARGHHAILIEPETLGGRQTLASQGILHGGQKYNLGGSSDSITEKLRDQPTRWLDAIAGRSTPDLTSVQILSHHQVMWPAGGLAAKTAAAIGVRTLEGHVQELPSALHPDIFTAIKHSGAVYQLNETILDIKSVVAALAANAPTYQAETTNIDTENGRVTSVHLHAPDGTNHHLTANAYIFAAGTGNEQAAAALGLPQPATQRRPLRQIMVRDVPWKLYGHGIRASPKPRITVTSHPQPGDPARYTWYLGGNVAEHATTLSDSDAIRFAAAELKAIFPGIDWAAHHFATWSIDRAEPHTPSGRLPPEPAIRATANTIVAWPTKLVLAPALADRALAFVADLGVTPSQSNKTPNLPLAPVGAYPWELATSWTTPA